MVSFRYHGNLYSLARAAEPMNRGQRISKNANGDWVVTPTGQKGTGWSYPTVRLLSSGTNIYNSNYDVGLASTFNGRRNTNRALLANVGEPIGVAIGAEVCMDEYDMYTGTIAAEDLLTVGASGLLEKTTNEDLACAKALTGGIATNGDRISIIGL